MKWENKSQWNNSKFQINYYEMKFESHRLSYEFGFFELNQKPEMISNGSNFKFSSNNALSLPSRYAELWQQRIKAQVELCFSSPKNEFILFGLSKN